MMFSLYLSHGDDESKIWLGGYDRSIVRRMVARYQPQKQAETMNDEQLDG